jgi:flagellar motor switch protein FliG
VAGSGRKIDYVTPDAMSGASKAALLLMVMGEEFTAKVFKHMRENEIRTIGEHMNVIKKVEPKTISSVLEEFLSAFRGNRVLGASGGDFFEKTISKAFDHKKANSLIGELGTSKGRSLFEQLESLSPELLVNFISQEHPQTIALILSHLNHQSAADAINLMPEGLQSEVIVRIAKLDGVPDDIINEIQETLAEQVSDMGSPGPRRLGGIEAAAEILNQVDRKTEQSILERIEEDQEELAEEIRQSMFIFEDLATLDDRSVRSLLKEVSNDELTLALKTASEVLRDKVLGNLSQRAADMLKEDMEVLGPVKITDVERAQQSIIKTARRLEEEGKIVLGGKGGEELV